MGAKPRRCGSHDYTAMTEQVGRSATDCQTEILGKIRSLPPFHPVASQVLQLFSSGDEALELNKVAQIMGSDPAFAAEMLQTANSPLFGLQCEVHSIRHALIVVGLERTKALAIGTALQIYLKDALDHPAMRRCWSHSLACAEIAKTMMASCGHDSIEHAYTGGLLHDIGRLALLKAFPADYVPLLEKSNAGTDGVIAAEIQFFGFDHCHAVDELYALWNFPTPFIEIALRHHDPVSGRENSLLNIVRISCRMADSLGFPAARQGAPSYEHLVSALPTEMRRRFEFSEEQLYQLVSDRLGGFTPALKNA
jgi:HD-like signal output (HDOD) protein